MVLDVMQGVDIFMKEDVMSGVEFMLNMVIVCLSITVGLLLSKVLLHDGVFGPIKMVKRRQRRYSRPNYFENQEGEPQNEDDTEQGSADDNEHEADEHVAI